MWSEPGAILVPPKIGGGEIRKNRFRSGFARPKPVFSDLILLSHGKFQGTKNLRQVLPDVVYYELRPIPGPIQARLIGELTTAIRLTQINLKG
jgi:hypothetical protein